MIELLLDSTLTDIPDQYRDKAFSLYNTLKKEAVWNTILKSNRTLVLTTIREWFDKLRPHLRPGTTSRTLPKELKGELWVANNHLTGVKESSPGCAACRARMHKRLQKSIEQYETEKKCRGTESPEENDAGGTQG